MEGRREGGKAEGQICGGGGGWKMRDHL